ncbi:MULTISPECIES: potassium transporter TrkA [unclassified Streptomyces]|uniref:Potassium transporter TrkA n=1 Tax=Streptomyces johnsoniae TaxID=3075532 RepID=A0ABU2S9X8_9ACTN|nr:MULTISPECIES: potassium transporter TrkA [unclassified Streptomyces]MDT0445779.1 potassium transporter TrkA [Streptomyces sp. DSM 41886]ONK15447.1 K(+)/H(+) antiporter subunit KhtT [Streptomyces sp. MP131-18]
MGQGVHVQDLPGVGKRYDIDLGRADQRISVVMRSGGVRDLYVFASDSADPTAVIELSEEQARKVGAVLAATFFEA